MRAPIILMTVALAANGCGKKKDEPPKDPVYAIWDTVHFKEGKVTKIDNKLGILVLGYPKPFDRDPP